MDNTKNIKRSAIEVESESVMTDLKFAQINLHHSKKATATFCRDLRMEQTDVSFIQEPWIRGNLVHGFGMLKNRLFYHMTGGKPILGRRLGSG